MEYGSKYDPRSDVASNTEQQSIPSAQIGALHLNVGRIASDSGEDADPSMFRSIPYRIRSRRIQGPGDLPGNGK